MSSVLASVLQNYLEEAWRENPKRLLFPNRKLTLPMWRDNVVKYGLKPVLKKLGIPTKFAGLHAFRHGLPFDNERNRMLHVPRLSPKGVANHPA